MGLNESFCDHQIGVKGFFVQDQGRSGGQHSDLYIVFAVAVVDQDLRALEYLVAQLRPELIGAGLPVAAGGYEKEDVYVGAPFPDLGQHLGDYVPAGDGPGVVRDYEAAGLFALRKVSQPGGSDGSLQGSSHQLSSGNVAPELSDM